ncbi:hypothetical protein E3C22_00365 [Jiella endophytica]|uniref:Uncharacterized protein n=1 Tax=Jiella endophytica TaxID=2558362 RepID=A0A4Y8REF4_9HYPH|nr:hypothetical protein [Jiella endophytica]TFF20675.1 hypothetical protein E3C22_17405 [Jiella endophytica]TFF26976.1 hypothetical protein E3C22_00365 [Jiella endophytica]
MKSPWLALMAALFGLGLLAAPAGPAFAQADDDDDKPAAGAATTKADDDDDSDGASQSASLVPAADGLKVPPGSELMPAAALNGDMLGLPKKSLTSQIVTPLILGVGGDAFKTNHKDFYLRAGQAYRWDIKSEGDIEYKFNAPDFFRNVWMNQIVIDDLEVHMAGAPAWLEYDSHGTITVQFQTVRPGRYEWKVGGLDEDHVMEGTITVVQ